LADFLNSSPLKPLIFKQELFLFTEDILEINQSETRIACGGYVS
jgi:hypothetical protein